MSTYRIVFSSISKAPSAPESLLGFVQGLQPQTFDPGVGQYRNVKKSVFVHDVDTGTVVMHLLDVDGREAASAFGRLTDMVAGKCQCTYGGLVNEATPIPIAA